MNMQLSSRLFLLGMSFAASTFLSTITSPDALAQVQATTFRTSSSSGYFEPEYHFPGGDYFSSGGDTFLSTGQQEPLRKTPEDSAFDDHEQIDPGAYTWSDDRRDAFASRTTDDLREFPLYQGRNKSFTFMSVSDAPQIKPEIQKSFDAPRAFEHPKYREFYMSGPPLPQPRSGTWYVDSFGHGTSLYGWKVNRQPVRVYFAGDVAEVRDGLVKRVFIECMRQWCGATRGRLKFMVTEDWKSADITLCREFTSNHEYAENLPSFRDAWLEHVKIRLLDSACDKIGEVQLRAVLLHSAGHALGYFEHTADMNSAMNENCARLSNPTQRLCPCDSRYIMDMYNSYKTCYDNRFKKETFKVIRVPWGVGLPAAPLAAGGPVRGNPWCKTKNTTPLAPIAHNVQRQKLTIKPPSLKRPNI